MPELPPEFRNTFTGLEHQEYEEFEKNKKITIQRRAGFIMSPGEIIGIDAPDGSRLFARVVSNKRSSSGKYDTELEWVGE